MTKDESDLVRRLVGRVQLLLDSNAQLRSECEQLKEELNQQKELYSQCKANLDEMKVQYENLRFAKVMTITDKEAEQTKRRLSNLMREIDKCISLLNV